MQIITSYLYKYAIQNMWTNVVFERTEKTTGYKIHNRVTKLIKNQQLDTRPTGETILRFSCRRRILAGSDVAISDCRKRNRHKWWGYLFDSTSLPFTREAGFDARIVQRWLGREKVSWRRPHSPRMGVLWLHDEAGHLWAGFWLLHSSLNNKAGMLILPVST